MRQRLALIHHIEKFKKIYPVEFEDVDIHCVELYVDIENSDTIMPIIASDQNKFRLIVLEILKHRYGTLYKKEDEDVTAMRFMGNNLNSRIYCKEIPGKFLSPKKVVMSYGLRNKTSQKNDKKNKPIIESIKNYEYEFKKNPIEVRKIRKGTG